MTGFIDAGGGQKGVYTSGIYDKLIECGIMPDYCIGVSAGSANIITYLAGQHGRTKRFYLDYSMRNEYMGARLMLKKRSYIDLDYIYTTISNSNGEDPLDFQSAKQNGCKFYAAATDAENGKPHYFSFNDFEPDNYAVLKASCAIPLVCQPVRINNKEYFDGGVAEPIPYKKALADGCDRLVVILTKSVNEEKKKMPIDALIGSFKRKYPQTASALMTMHQRYNDSVNELKELEKQGKALIVSPIEKCNVKTVTRNRVSLEKLYNEGYKDAERIIEFLTAEQSR